MEFPCKPRHDAGIAVSTYYTADGSGATLYDAATAMVDVFKYSNAILGESGTGEVRIRRELLEMINPNLDAGLPVIVGIRTEFQTYTGHAPVCDGYGYNNSTLYHHLNMGWYGQNDCWYNLPDVNVPDAIPFDIITRCVYNVFTEGKGEIISGRVIDDQSKPLANVVVTAQSENGGNLYTAVTNDKGIYALTGVASDSKYAITLEKLGYDFAAANAGEPIETERSSDGTYYCGNKWGVDFRGFEGGDSITIATDASQWDYPLHTSRKASRTQVIYLADEIGRGGTITALALDVMDVPDQKMDNWTIRIRHTGRSEYSTCALEATGWTVVYRRDQVISEPGWHRFDFQTPYQYNGTDNLLIDFSHNGSVQTNDGICRTSAPGGARSVYAYSDGGNEDPTNWSGPSAVMTYCGDNIPNVKLTFYNESDVVSGNTKLVASDGRRNDHFGCSVSISGNYAIVGAYGDDNKCGAAYVFKRESEGWIEQAKLRAFDAELFGFSVAISGDHAIIGAGDRSDACNPCGSFAAYVFVRKGEDWTRQAELFPSASSSSERFGCSVSINSKYAIVGSPGDEDMPHPWNSNNEGSVFVFERNDADWAYSARLRTSDLADDGNFGSSVSICEDCAIATQDFSRDYGEQYGPAFIFKHNGVSWVEQAMFAGGGYLELFGHSSGISEDWAIVGAPKGDGNKDISGAVYVYNRAGTHWEQRPKLTAQDGDTLDRFGNSVAINGDYIIVGAPEAEDYYSGDDSGSAYIFKRTATGWTQQAKLTSYDGNSNSHFGCSVAIDGDYAIVGAEDDNGNVRKSGAVYVFRRIGSTWGP